MKHGRVKNDNGKYSYGGRSKKITVNRRFVTKIPKSYPLEKAALIMCPGQYGTKLWNFMELLNIIIE